ncbi:MAG: UbiA family prenyltransferase [Chloroflexota bacterium]
MGEKVGAVKPAAGSKIVDAWRLLHPLPSLMTVVASGAFILLAAHGMPPIGTLLHLLTIEACRQFSISAFNDYFDRDVDRGRADKPVAAGAIGPAVAALVGTLFGAVCLLLSLPFGIWFVLLTAIGLGGGLLYDAGLKYTALSWLPFSVAFPTLPLWAWVGVHPGGDFPAQLFWAVPVAGVMVLGIHLADTIPDLASDTEAGVLGLAHRLGMNRSLALCWAAFGTCMLMTVLLAFFLPYRLEWYIPGLIAGAILMSAAIVLYLANHSRLKQMSLLLEIGALALAVGWVGAIVL